MVQGVMGPTRREACGSICRLLLEDMVKTQAGLSKMANRYTEVKSHLQRLKHQPTHSVFYINLFICIDFVILWLLCENMYFII